MQLLNHNFIVFLRVGVRAAFLSSLGEYFLDEPLGSGYIIHVVVCVFMYVYVLC